MKNMYFYQYWVLKAISESGKGEKLIIVTVLSIPLKKDIYLYRSSEKTKMR